MKEFVFAVDIDGVLRDLVKSCVDIYNENFNSNRTVESVTKYSMADSFPDVPEPQKWFFQDHSKEVFLDSEVIHKAKESIDMLRELGNVIIITFQESYKNKLHTLEWLEKNKFNYDGLCFMKNKELLDADFLIDDNQEFLINFLNKNESKCGILIDAPYNLKVNEKLYNKNLLKMKDLSSVAEFFNKNFKEYKV